MDNQRAQNVYSSPPPYTPYPNSPGYPVQASYPPNQYPSSSHTLDQTPQNQNQANQPPQNPDYIEYNGDTTYEPIGDTTTKKQQQNTGLDPAQVGYNPAQTFYPINGPVGAYNPTNQQPTTVYIQTIITPLENPPPTYLVQSILTFIFCCWIFGLIAILKSVASDSAAKTGRRDDAVRESAQARKWNIVGLIVGIFIWVACIVTFTVLLVVDIDD